jgi:hypothetical protein
MRRSPIITAAILTAVLALGALAGCGTSSGSDDSSSKSTTTKAKSTTTTEADADTVAPEAWAETFCGNLDAWTSAIGAASEGVGEGVQVGDAKSSQTAVADLYAASSAATQKLIDEIKSIGVPDITDGDKFVDDLVAAFEAFDAAALEAKANIEALPTDDIATFQTGIDDLGAQFQADVDKVSKSISALGTTYPSVKLSNALTKSCA